jgi:hypothetical protein
MLQRFKYRGLDRVEQRAIALLLVPKAAAARPIES